MPSMATTSEIKARYKYLAKQHHPDKAGDTQTMTEINKAYSVLSDPKKRLEYNATYDRLNTITADSIGNSRPRQSPRTSRQSAPRTVPDQPEATAPLTFHPFRSVGFVAIFILGLTLLGLLGLVRENNTKTPLNSTGSSNTTPSTLSTQPTTTPQTMAQSTPSVAPKAGSDTSTGSSLYSFGSGLVSGTQHFYKEGKTMVDNCSTAGNQILQTETKLEAEISATQTEIANLTNYHKANVWWESSSDASSASAQLSQQLEQYKSQLSALESSVESC